jgi:hypothetical protein
MTVKELKEIINNLPEDMQVGGVGWMGEFLDIEDISVGTALKDNQEIEILEITMEWAGEIPD